MSTATIWTVLHDAGFAWQRDRSWCETGASVRQRQHGTVTLHDLDAVAKNPLIEAAYRQTMLPVWTEDEAGPYQTLPYPGAHWQLTGFPVRHPEYVRCGTAKQLTLFHPASGAVRVTGVRRCTNAVLHPWLEAELAAILAALPEPTETLSVTENWRCWARWQERLTVRITLPEVLPPLRMLLVLDNLTGHRTASFVLQLFDHRIMPLYTPLSGSWLNLPKGHPRSRSNASSRGGR